MKTSEDETERPRSHWNAREKDDSYRKNYGAGAGKRVD